MDFGALVGQMMRDGLSSSSVDRLQNSLGQGGLGGLGASGGLDSLLGSILGANAGGTGQGHSQSQGGGLGDLLGGLGGAGGLGGLSGGQLGTIGALAGAFLNRGSGGSAMGGALKGGAMAILGTLALSALKNWQAGSAETQGFAASDAEVAQMAAPETAELCVRAMIEASKADGQVGEAEIEAIVGRFAEGGVTTEEKQYIMDHLKAPSDQAGLIASIPNPEVGAQVYAAALMAITVDTPGERAFMAELARGAGLDAGTVDRLHTMVGAPSMYA